MQSLEGAHRGRVCAFIGVLAKILIIAAEGKKKGKPDYKL
jgi:hypothetical protein